ncbi:MAG: preprotein translocase subunit SecG [Pseudomonadota bacterium]
MLTFLTVLHVVVCVFLVIVVLLQHGKGADVGATFGGASQTVFGARGAATLLNKVTIGAAFVFMVTSISLAYLSSSTSAKSLFKEPANAQGTVIPTPAVTGSPAAAIPSAGTPSATQAVAPAVTPPSAPAK